MDTLVEKEGAKLPQEIPLISLIQSRYSELNQIINEFKTSSPKLASQKLPIHMRRRAASHNVNRLPSKTRTIISKKTQGRDVISEGKEKKRNQLKKYRNHNKVRLSHVAREIKPDRTLLHLWFVKRFKMVYMFGQFVPGHNTTKNQRKLQRMSKSGCTHFHLPQFKSIIIRIKNVDVVSQKLSDLAQDDLKVFFADHPSSEGNATWTQFYSDHGASREIIGPGYLIFDPKHDLLIIWCHILIQSRILTDLLASFRDSLDEVIDGDKFYKLFSLVGPESLPHLKKVLADSDSSLPDRWAHGSVFRVGDSRFADCPELQKVEAIGEFESECIIINTMKVNNREMILITVPHSKTKEFWYELVKNRTHLVGGFRDLQLLTCEMRCLHFPFIGYPDLLDGINSLRSTWSHIMKINTDCPHYSLLRDRIIVNKLKSAFSDLPSVKALLATSPNLRNCLIFVEIICVNRGTLEKGDIICLPTADDVAKYIGRRKIDTKLDRIGHGPVEQQKVHDYASMEKSSRRVIGLVEFGYFSLDIGASRGFGAVVLFSLSDLVESSDKKAIALVRSVKSNSFRFVEIVIDCFNPF